jgi:predicted enzyme related to lactoylglutathione lyase
VEFAIFADWSTRKVCKQAFDQTKKQLMMKIDPIIAVKDVEASSNWYQSIFGCRSMHGGKDFDILVTENGEVLLCLHKWGEHQHPSMADPGITAGNGLILYFRTKTMELIRQNAEKAGACIVEDIHLNPNSTKHEFSVRDPDGYYLTITDFHEYEG